MTNKNQRYVGACRRCQRRVATTVNRREEHHTGDPFVSIRCSECGKTVVGNRSDLEGRRRPWAGGPPWLVDAERPDVRDFPNYRELSNE